MTRLKIPAQLSGYKFIQISNIIKHNIQYFEIVPKSPLLEKNAMKKIFQILFNFKAKMFPSNCRKNQTDNESNDEDGARQFTKIFLRSVDILLGSTTGWRDISDLTVRYNTSAIYIRYA